MRKYSWYLAHDTLLAGYKGAAKITIETVPETDKTSENEEDKSDVTIEECAGSILDRKHSGKKILMRKYSRVQQEFY